jgi:hypothetical protein
MDFMSRSNFFLAGDNAASLLNTSTLVQHSQNTFQTFFKHFAARGNRDGNSLFWDDVDSRIDGTVVQRMPVLKMNETATWLSIAIISLLIATLFVVVITLQVGNLVSSMQHPIECLADTLMIIAGSDEFVSLLSEGHLEKISRVQTRLGWFKDVRGVDRWGIEVVDGAQK